MIKICITGTIGSGKTFALNFFKSKRIKTFSADFEVKNILKGILVKEKIFKLFPEAFISKKLNKSLLASIVFNNSKKLSNLEKIIHPLVKLEKKKFLEKNKNKKILVMEIPLIFEKKSIKNYDYIILMSVNKKNQFNRIKNRKNMSYKLFNKILKNQISNTKKRFAHFVINNNHSKIETKKKLQIILNKILSTSL